MVKSWRGLFAAAVFCLGIVLAVGVPAAPAFADVLQIQFSGLNLTYDGTTICDSTSCLGGGGVQATSDPLLTMLFLVNGVQVGTTLTTDIWADIIIPVGPLPVSGTTPGTGGIFDLLTMPTVPGWGLALDNIAYSIITAPGTVSVLGSGTVVSIFFQDLPFSLTIGQPVSWSFSTSVLTSTVAGGFLTSFTSAGTGEVIGQTAPEPASALLFGSGLLSLAWASRRKRGFARSVEFVMG